MTPDYLGRDTTPGLSAALFSGAVFVAETIAAVLFFRWVGRPCVRGLRRAVRRG